MSEIQTNKKLTASKPLVVLSIILAVSLIFNFILIQRNGSKLQKRTDKIAGAIIQPVSAEEIYPMFICPCCGKPLDPKNICCGMAKEMIDYIDVLVAKNLPEKEIILAFVKKYGLNTFADKNKQKEFREELIKTAPADRPIISLTPETFDFGNVSQKGVIVTTFFELKNEGKKDLVIDRLDTSCGCTSASIVFEDKEGPKFAMSGHGIESPKDWKLTIPAGKNAQLKLYYDPNIHKDFRGAATREIYVYSNDPIDFEKKVKIELNQVD